MFTDINRMAEHAKEDPKRQFSSIAHLITVAKLYEAFRGLRKNASAGIDGVTYEQYETNAEENIRQLHQRLKEGKYRAQPLRRVYIPKEDGKQRPFSIQPRTRGGRERNLQPSISWALCTYAPAADRGGSECT
jgi:RNA-directed DNA polymerase